METLKQGTRIYTTGDMANDGGFGSITKIISGKWGLFYNVKMEDGREKDHLPHCCFSDKFLGHGGTRFVTADAYDVWRKERIAKCRCIGMNPATMEG